MSAHFGPAGNARSFAAAGGRDVLDAPAFVKSLGLDAYEYEGGHGIHISRERAEELGRRAREAGVALSVHAPYYISLASRDPQKRENSVGYILASARAAHWMGAARVVVHPGSLSGQGREEAMALAAETLGQALVQMERECLSDVTLCPETMGRESTLGSLEEILSLCAAEPRLLPCIDFGHLNARSGGGLMKPGAVAAVFDAMERTLGQERAGRFHAHFSKIEYGPKGELRHLTFEDDRFGPEFSPVAEETARRGLSPVFICESAGTQAEDAAVMRGLYETALRT